MSSLVQAKNQSSSSSLVIVDIEPVYNIGITNHCYVEIMY